MEDEIDFMADEKLWAQVADVLRRRIRDGTYPPHQKIPSIVQLQGELGVSPGTVRRALAELKGEGLLRPLESRGTYVTEQPT